MPRHPRPRFLRLVLLPAVLAALGASAPWSARARPAAALVLQPRSDGSLVPVLQPLPGDAGRTAWRWRTLTAAGWSEWSAPEPSLHPLAPPPGARAVEAVWEAVLEDGLLRRSALWRSPAAGRDSGSDPVRRAAPVAAKRRADGSTVVQGRLLYRDRAYGLSGYLTTSRLLPVRACALELARLPDDSLLASGTTSADGSFALTAVLSDTTTVRLRVLAQAVRLGVELRVVDRAGPAGDLTGAHSESVTAAIVASVAPGATVSLGTIALHDATGQGPVQALNLLDCAEDCVDFLASPYALGAPPVPGSVPPIVWDPAGTIARTAYADGAFRVASPGSGDTDGWADALLLAVMGQWALQRFGRLDLTGTLDLAEADVDPRLAYGDGSALAFACAVRAWRAGARQAEGGAPADSAVSQIVDLGFPPPLGFSALAQGGVDLETRALTTGEVAAARGQLGVVNVAAMLWDLIDGASTADGAPGDDDPLEADGTRWFAQATAGAVGRPAADPLTYQDLHALWLAAYGDAAALRTISVEQGGTALFVDAAEPDNLAAAAPLLLPWAQPPLNPGGRVVLGELLLGERDAVELTNSGASTADLSSWSVAVRRNGFGAGATRTTTLPAGVRLAPGRSLVLHEGGNPAQNRASDLYDPAWSIPWREQDDGACILRNAAGVAVDFVRWSGGGGSVPSQEPVPAGQVFTGTLLAPGLGFSLARDSLATDTDSAADFTPRLPTPRLPNVERFAPRTLYPTGDVDLVRIPMAAGALVQVHADRPVDDARPQLAWLSDLGAVLSQADPLNALERSAALVLYAPTDTVLTIRLQQQAATLAAGGAALLVWRPASAASLLAPLALSVHPRNLDPSFDQVEARWTNAGAYDSLRVVVDGAVATLLPGSATQTTIGMQQGHHSVSVRPVTLGVAGASAVASVFVGPTACRFEARLDGPDVSGILSAVTLQGFATGPPGFDGPLNFRDGPLSAPSYAPSSEATLTLNDPIDLTSDSRLRFVHAAHLADDGDVALAEISVDDGGHWIELARYRGADHQELAGDPANWLDGLLTPADWVHESLDVSTYAGQRARVRLRRVSDASGQSYGWTIDDLEFGPPAGSRVRWVAPSGSDVFGCGPAERPFATVGAASSAAAPGDTIALSAGTFTAPSPVVVDGLPGRALIPLKSGITVLGRGTGVTLLNASALTWAVASGGPGELSPQDTTARVRGLTISGPVVGALLDSCSAALEDVELRGCAIGVVIRGGLPRMRRVLIAGGGSGILVRRGALRAERCTLAGLAGGIVLEAVADSLALTRCILTHVPGVLLTVQAPQAVLRMRCNDFFGAGRRFDGPGVTDSLAMAGNFSFEPYFCNEAGGDYRLAAGSPAADLAGCGPLGALGVGCATATLVPGVPTRTTLALLPNVPNPFNPRTAIRLELDRESEVEVTIVDARGRLVRSLLDGVLPAGPAELVWDGRDGRGRTVASGVYYVLVRRGATLLHRPIALVR
jgi:hypothetical protein